MTDSYIPLLHKFRQEPGQCSYEELLDIAAFLETFQWHLDVYRPVFGEPVGASLAAKIETMEGYLNRALEQESDGQELPRNP